MAGRVFTYGGVRLVTDEISYEFVRGAKIDYVDELIKAAFEVPFPSLEAPPMHACTLSLCVRTLRIISSTYDKDWI